MNCGVKVPVAGVVFRLECDRWRDSVPFAGLKVDSNREKDWFREWLGAWELERGEVNTADFGRLAATEGRDPGEGEGELRLNGLLRRVDPFAAGNDMMMLNLGLLD